MPATTDARGILSEENTEKREEIIEMLKQAPTGWRSRR